MKKRKTTRKPKLKYKRILLKLSGEALQGNKKSGIDSKFADQLAKEIAEVHKLGVEIGIVIGGGNIWRYRDFKETGIERTVSDNMGMMATVMNGAAMRSSLAKLGLEARMLTALRVPQIAEEYYPARARNYFDKGRIVICVGGTGNPFFTTDSAAALRSLELNCDILFKATKVDGVYDSDPVKNKKAKFFPEITYKDVLKLDLKVMDLSAISLCKEGKMPILVFNLFTKGNIKRAVMGEKLGTIVR